MQATKLPENPAITNPTGAKSQSPCVLKFPEASQHGLPKQNPMELISGGMLLGEQTIDDAMTLRPRA